MKLAIAGMALVLAACSGDFNSMQPPPSGADAGPAGTPDGAIIFEDLDKARAQARFESTTDLMRYVVAPTCAAETNECHNSEDPPDMSSEGNLWNLVGLPCNDGVGERETIEEFCEQLGDEIRIVDGENAGFTTRIGSITLVTDAEGAFTHYEVRVQAGPPLAQTDAQFEILRGGTPMGALGAGVSLTVGAGSTSLLVTDPDDIRDPVGVRQGDENRNGIFGDGSGTLVQRGDARASYFVRRLVGETERVRMPLNENADNPTEMNRFLSPDEMYAVMSWINCMLPTDTVYSPIRYDCEANADNEGVW